MPEKIKKKLKKYAKKKFPGDKEKQNSYIYGTLNKIENMARGGVLKEIKLPEQKLREGGVLKPIPEGNKGLPNLPKKVRNTMGYMQEGGKVVKYKSISELEENMAEGGEVPVIGDKYKRRRKRKARRQKKGKKQKGSCYNIGGETICPGDKGYNPNLIVALQGMEIPSESEGEGKDTPKFDFDIPTKNVDGQVVPDYSQLTPEQLAIVIQTQEEENKKAFQSKYKDFINEIGGVANIPPKYKK